MNKATEFIQKYTGHKYVKLTSRGNSAIFAAMYCCRRLSHNNKVLVPDQGGWLTYLNHPKKLEMETVQIKTDYGIIDIKDLKNNLDGASLLIYSNPAGYFAEQPIKKIYKLCTKKGVRVILDVSGCIGTEMCDGRYADLTIASFGKWKPINVGYGGEISALKKDYLTNDLSVQFDKSYLRPLAEKLQYAQDRYQLFQEHVERIKEDLRDFNILHRDKKGINVIVGYKEDAEKEKLIEYCKSHHYEYTECPRYIRVNSPAISIEVKRK
jgi:hypothetical protein